MTDESGKGDPRKHNPGKSGEDDFDEYLAGHSPVSKNYEGLGDEGPSPQLDARILAEAERPTKVRPPLLRSKTATWTVPLAIAATIMLSFSLVMNIVNETEKPPLSRSNSAEVARRRAPASKVQALVPADTLTTGRIEADLADTPRDIDELKAEKPAAMPAEPLAQDAIRDEAVYSAARATSMREMSMAAPAPSRDLAAKDLTATDLAAMVEMIRGYLDTETPPRVSGATNLMAETEMSTDRVGKSSIVVTARRKDQYTSPAGQLEEILTLYDANQSDAVDAAIREFRGQYPEHPVSVLLLERGF